MIQEHTIERIKQLNKELAESTGFDKFNELQDAMGHYIDVAESEFKRLKEGREKWKRKFMEKKNDIPPN